MRVDAEGKLVGNVYNYDRTGMVWVLLGLFALIMVAVGGKKGAAALYALVFTFVCVICVFVPLLYVGMNGILAAIITAVLVLFGLYLHPQRMVLEEPVRCSGNHRGRGPFGSACHDRGQCL